MKVADTVALVTGGASGLGAATVRELVGAGGKAMIVDRPQSDGAKLAEELGTNVAFAAADVTSDAEVAAAVQQTIERFGAIHINVNCAGTGAAVAAFDGQIGQAAYSASKGGVVAMTLPIARDLAPVGIRICTIAPGTFDTPMLALLPDPQRQALAAQIPFPPRLGKPPEFAALARHIVENAMLNGETIRLDGALRMPPK
jgi:NAD(P)-dependent dehydrogenase (short-subunit alcohol dehydrogenase family)